MSYTHDGKKQVIAKNDPVDPDGIDWAFFAYDDWLRTDETITSHSALIQGGVIETDSTFLGNVVDPDGTVYTQCYGVEFSVEPGATQVVITHRVSTTVAGAVDLGRTDIDRSVVIPVKEL